MLIESIDDEHGIPGVILGETIQCQYCFNTHPDFFHTYFNHTIGKEITYCRKCVTMTYASTHHYFKLCETEQMCEHLTAKLDFNLSAQQQFASESIVQAVENYEKRLLYAVTGAGKTEMLLKGIETARRKGLNVAVVSPRTDVVKELALRMKTYFDADIDVLYEGQNIEYQARFVICTMHQLFKFRKHFGMMIIDEIDAFPATYDERLFNAANNACSDQYSLFYLSATPSKAVLKEFHKDEIIILPARYHKRPLIVPTYHYLSINALKRGKLFSRLKARKEGTYLLVFFSDIVLMESIAEIYQNGINLVTVSSEDAARHEKVEAIRGGKYQVIFTTTILERGFTMANLDVWIIDAGQFDRHTLIQMAGRVDRKSEPYNGEVCFFHQGVTLEMLGAVKTIKHMNKEGRKKGWIK